MVEEGTVKMRLCVEKQLAGSKQSQREINQLNGMVVDKWDASAEPVEWDTLSIEASISMTDTAAFLERCAPSTDTPCDLVLLAVCRSTRWSAVAQKRLATSSAVLSLLVPKGFVRGQLEVAPYVILAEDLDAGVFGRAKTKGAILATGNPVCIYVDTPADRLGQGIIREWQSFSDDCKDALYRLAYEERDDALVPVVYFNSRHPGARYLVDYTHREPAIVAARDAVFSLVATEVWMELASFAAQHYSDTEDEGDSSAQLADRVLKTLSRKLGRPRDFFRSAVNEEGPRSELAALVQSWLRTATAHETLVGTFHLGED